MTDLLATYISLPGTTEEAMRHWQEVFGGELEVLRYEDVKIEGMPFTPDPKAVAHAVLTLDAGVIAGGDAMDDGHDYAVGGTAYSLLYSTETASQSRDLIDKLVAGGGKEGMPFERAPWGGWYGQVFDRYGVMWAFSAVAD